jgi:hypothetical protein
VEKISIKEEKKISLMMRNLKSMRVGKPKNQPEGNKILEKLGKQLEENFNKTLREINPQNINESFHQSDLSFKSHRKYYTNQVVKNNIKKKKKMTTKSSWRMFQEIIMQGTSLSITPLLGPVAIK